MADEHRMPTRRKRKKTCKKLGNNPPRNETSEILDKEWKAVDPNEDIFSSSGQNEFLGLEELTSYNEDDLQAFVAAEYYKKSNKRRKKTEFDDKDGTLDTPQTDLIDKTDNDKNQNQVNKVQDKSLKTTPKSGDKPDSSDNTDIVSVTKALTRKERKRIENKQYRLNKLKEKRKQWRLQNKEDKRKLKEAAVSEGSNVDEEKARGSTDQQKYNPTLSFDENDHAVNENTVDLSDWTGLGVPNEILKSIAKLNFLSPTEIQKKCLPHAILNHKDVLGAAETGSGKTLAFGIPVVTNIMQMKKRQAEKNKTSSVLKGLIITPTRELALQIHEHLKVISKYTDVTSCVLVGGLAPEKQQRLLSRSPDIVIATPGRLLQLILGGNSHLAELNKLKFLVIDECDRLFEQGHFKDLNDILERINDGQKCSKQTLIFSATLTLQQNNKGKTSEDFQSLFKKVGLSPRAVTVDLTQKHVTTKTLTQMKVMCNNDEKESYLMYFLLNHRGRTILFTNTISETKKLCAILDVLKQNPLQLHAGKQQKQRLKCLERFKTREDGLLVCTDVAARGLDIPDVENVVHFRLPKDPKVYVHRSGRTARAKKNGLSLILEGPEDFNSYKKIASFLKLDAELPNMSIDRGVFDAVLQRVRLAKDIEKLTYRARKESSENSWMSRVSKAMEIDIDLDESPSMEDKREKMLVKEKQNQLNRLLKMKMFSSQFSGKYPTRNGNIVVPRILPMK